MPRPSKNIDQALLASGRALFPGMGCAGLSVRAVVKHADVNLGMFHYHFKTKEAFLHALLQSLYEEMFASFSVRVAEGKTTLDKLRAALTVMAHFVRANRQVIARVWTDSIAGERVALEFFQRNAPRHLSVLFELLHRAEQEAQLTPLPPLQQFSMLAGSVLLPMLFVSALFESAAEAIVPSDVFFAQVMSDEAIAERIELALASLRLRAASSRPPRRPATKARTTRTIKARRSK